MTPDAGDEDGDVGEDEETSRCNGYPDSAKEQLLHNETRRRIYDLITELPGLNKNLVAKGSGISLSLADFHITRMEEPGILVTKPAAKEGETLCFRAEDVHLWEDPQTRILYGRSPTRNVALYLAENPGTSTEEICEAVEVSDTTVRYHLRSLRHRCLACLQRLDRRVVYHPQDALLDWVEEVGNRFPKPWETDDEGEDGDL